MALTNKKLQCEKCGSVYFQPAEFREFYSGRYSATPGGELYPVEGQEPVSVRVCLCGYPARPAHILDVDTRGRFLDSLQKALAFRATCEPRALRQQFHGEYARRQELVELQQALSRLHAVVASYASQDRPTKQPSRRGDSKAAGADNDRPGLAASPKRRR